MPAFSPTSQELAEHLDDHRRRFFSRYPDRFTHSLKGGEYRYVALTYDEKTLEVCVVYTSTVWKGLDFSRPLCEFTGVFVPVP